MEESWFGVRNRKLLLWARCLPLHNAQMATPSTARRMRELVAAAAASCVTARSFISAHKLHRLPSWAAKSKRGVFNNLAVR